MQQAANQTQDSWFGSNSRLADTIARVPFEVWILFLWSALFINAATGFIRFDTNENRIGAYALDVLQNGHWIAQSDSTGAFITKPPAMTWLVVLFSKILGGLSTTALYLPSALAMLGVAILVFRSGREFFSFRAGVLAAVFFIACYPTDRQLLTARYDGLFTFPVALGAIAAYRAWATGKGWFIFWVAMTFGVMVKGPLVFVLGLVGLCAALWERNPGRLLKWNRAHLAGLAIFALICGGWLILVLLEYPRQFMEIIIGKELVGHAISDDGRLPGQQIWRAPVAIFVQFLPWSIPGVGAIIRIFRSGRTGNPLSFERYLVCWFLGGLLLFALAAHQRDRLLWPLLPAFALLAGRQVDTWLVHHSKRFVIQLSVGVCVGFFLFSILYHQVLLGGSSHTRKNLALKSVSADLRARFGERPAIAYVDSPFAVQFYLGYLQPTTSLKSAEALLAGSNPAYVLVTADTARKISKDFTQPIFCIDRWRLKEKEELQLLANRSDAE